MSTPTLDPALDPQGLSSAQYQAQARYGALAALAVYESWRSLDLLNIPGSVGGWLDALTPRLVELRERSARSSASYLTRLRAAEGLSRVEDILPAPTTPAMRDALRASLSVTGPVALQTALRKSAEAARNETKYREPVIISRGADLEQGAKPTLARAGSTPTTPARVGRANPNLPPTKLQVIQAATARAAIRHVRDGGRDTADTVMRTDNSVIGYVRITSGKPCYFCALLASRGPVYEDDSFKESNARFSGPGNQKVHDNCNCFLRPLYSQKNENFIDQHRIYNRIYLSVEQQRNNRQQINAFRRAYNTYLKTGVIDDGKTQ